VVALKSEPSPFLQMSFATSDEVQYVVVMIPSRIEYRYRLRMASCGHYRRSISPVESHSGMLHMCGSLEIGDVCSRNTLGYRF